MVVQNLKGKLKNNWQLMCQLVCRDHLIFLILPHLRIKLGLVKALNTGSDCFKHIKKMYLSLNLKAGIFSDL